MARVRRPLEALLAALLVAQAMPFLVANPLHPWRGETSIWSPRAAQMLRGRPLLGELYRETAGRLAASGCGRIGLDLPPDAWEYPLWVVLRQATATPLRLASLRPRNVSVKLRDPAFEPCAVVCLRCPWQLRALHTLRFGEPELTGGVDPPFSGENLIFLE